MLAGRPLRIESMETIEAGDSSNDAAAANAVGCRDGVRAAWRQPRPAAELDCESVDKVAEALVHVTPAHRRDNCPQERLVPSLH